jgi:hypothetical protein
MSRRPVLWTLALLITLGSAAYQRRTGPTYPVGGKVVLGGEEIRLKLTRTHGGEGDQPVEVTTKDPAVTAEVAWRRYPTDDPMSWMPMKRTGDLLTASLPHQPPAGKLEYQLRLVRGEERVLFPPKPAVTRFKGGVTAAVLVPHVFCMFTGMLLSTAAGLFVLAKDPGAGKIARVTLGILFVGGLILGPIVQKQAFGEFWTGVPWGWDLTDNKTLIAVVAWALAVALLGFGRTAIEAADRPAARAAILLATVATMVVFAIPHSTWGSEIRWQDHPASSPAATSGPADATGKH